jgi:NAD(P)-dependent dehydrogenase (short-subunit alcohol dehydrogenase family)
MTGNAGESSVSQALVEHSSNIGDFHGFIHVAGLFCPGPFLWELDEHDFENIFDASARAAYHLVRHAVPGLRENGSGLAVFFGSGATHKVQIGIAAYSASKAAEEHMARIVAAEAPNITTFVFRPGIFETRMQKQARESTWGGS